MISFSITRRTSSVPSRFAADTARTRMGAARVRSAFNVRAVCGKSVFVATMNPGRLESPGKYSSNSRLRISNASQGLTPSPLDKSTTYANASHRSTCRKKLCPNPLFSCAPLIKPGISASVIVSPSVADTRAKLWLHRGERVRPDARRRVGQSAQERALSRVWQSHQPDVGDGFQLQHEFTFFTRRARLARPGFASRRACVYSLYLPSRRGRARTFVRRASSRRRRAIRLD